MTDFAMPVIRFGCLLKGLSNSQDIEIRSNFYRTEFNQHDFVVLGQAKCRINKQAEQ